MNHSYTWAGAENHYWYLNTYPSRASHATYISDLTNGDILQMDFTGDGVIDHSMIVTKVDASGNIYLSYLTTGTLNKAFSTISSNYSSAIYYGWKMGR